MGEARGGGRAVARAWHATTAVVAVTALVLQLVLVLGADGASLGVRLGRLVSYFTIQSNLLVAVGTATLARDPERDGTTWRAVRLAGLVGITVTGLVHFFLLRPLIHVHGWDLVCDRMLHVAVPALTVVGWLLLGPRPRVTWQAFGWALAWPLAWLVWTLTVGGLTGWYPYPFLDVDEKGWGSVLGTSLGITVLFLLLFAAVAALDRRLRSSHERA